MAESLTPVEKVFKEELLLDKILEYAILLETDEVDRDALYSTRVVNSNWRESVTRLLRQWNTPLFYLVLDKSNSVNGSDYVNQNGKLLDQFVDYMASHPTVPTFKLKLLEDFFREENVASLARCWRLCGDGLLKLTVVFPMEGSSFPSILPRVTFPKLSRLRVVCSEIQLENLADGEEFVDDWAFSNLLNSLLTDTPSLSNLVIKGVENDVPDIPESWKYLSLPLSLTSLDLSCIMSSNIFEGLFVRNQVPDLKKLEVFLHIPSLREGLFFQVLENLKDSLEILTIMGPNYQGPARDPTYLRLPVMNKLAILNVNSIHCELEDQLFSVEQFLPNLRSLTLYQQTVPMRRKWIENQTFSSVQSLFIETVDENFRYKDWSNFIRSLDAQTCQQIQMAFPNVTKLQLSISMDQTCGLKYIFMEMKQLTSLDIEVAGTAPDRNSDFWDSLLIGAPIEVVAGLRANPYFWGNVQLDLDQFPALNNLRATFAFVNIDLKSLSLKEDCDAPAEYKANLSLPPLISDLAFHFTFLKMAKLKTLKFQHRFAVSEKMAEKWRSLDRTLVYTTWETE